MKLRFSPVVFSSLYCISYVAAYVGGWPLFRYYPVPREWAFGVSDSVVRPGPVIVWYGLVASAALVALIAAVLVPDHWLATGLRNRLWILPYAAVAACLYMLRPFFT